MTERLGMHHEVQPSQDVFCGSEIFRDRLRARCEMLSRRNENGLGAGQEGDTIAKSISSQCQTKFPIGSK